MARLSQRSNDTKTLLSSGIIIVETLVSSESMTRKNIKTSQDDHYKE